MKSLLAIAIVTVLLLTVGVCFAQNANMIGGGRAGWMGGDGYGGIWLPTLLVIVVVGLAAWSVTHKRK